jgi:hypothetical protein
MVERIEKRIKAVDTKRKRKDDLMLFQRIELKQVLLDIEKINKTYVNIAKLHQLTKDEILIYGDTLKEENI